MKYGDRVMTPLWAASDMIRFFDPSGVVLEPFRGTGVFTSLCPSWKWCEIDEGRDFLDWTESVNWIMSNPPYSKLRKVWNHAATLSENIVFLIPLRNYFSGYGFIEEGLAYGGIKHIRLYGTGSRLGFPMGNAIGALHWKQGYTGPTTWSKGPTKPVSTPKESNA